MSSEQIRLQVLNRSGSTAGSRKWSGSEFQTLSPATENARVPKVLRELAELTVDDIWQIAGAGDQQFHNGMAKVRPEVSRGGGHDSIPPNLTTEDQRYPVSKCHTVFIFREMLHYT